MLMPRRDRIAKSFLRFAHRDRDGNRQASLPGATKRAVADDLRGQFHVRVRQHDHVIFRAALALHALAAGCGARVHVLGHRRRADEADGAHLRDDRSSASTTALARRSPDSRRPCGKPVFSISSITRRMVSGTRSDGFRTNVFPHAIA